MERSCSDHERLKAKQQIPFFDSMYQGFASGNPESDAWPVRYFVNQNFDVILVAQSYAKNFGLYGERAGCLHVVTSSPELTGNIFSQLRTLQRVTVSTRIRQLSGLGLFLLFWTMESWKRSGDKICRRWLGELSSEARFESTTGRSEDPRTLGSSHQSDRYVLLLRPDS
jgi:hypothetical protein